MKAGLRCIGSTALRKAAYGATNILVFCTVFCVSNMSMPEETSFHQPIIIQRYLQAGHVR